jgi:hypothetical protein
LKRADPNHPDIEDLATSLQVHFPFSFLFLSFSQCCEQDGFVLSYIVRGLFGNKLQDEYSYQWKIKVLSLKRKEEGRG